MKNLYLTLITFLFPISIILGQNNVNLNIGILLDCFSQGQTDAIEHANKLNFDYNGIKEEESGMNTLNFTNKLSDQLNLTYNLSANKCVFVQLITTDNKIFYKIKYEILKLNPKFVKTYNDGNGVISIYKGNKYTYRIITDIFKGIRLNLIVIKLN